MKKFLFAVVCLWLYCLAFAQEKNNVQEILEAPLPEECSVWNTDDASRNACLTKHRLDVQYAIDKALAEKNRVNHFNYEAFGPQKTREEIAQEKREFILCCFAAVFILACVCFALFPVVKNKFNRIKNKTKLHRKQRAGKHTLDDVFAAEKKE